MRINCTDSDQFMPFLRILPSLSRFLADKVSGVARTKNILTDYCVGVFPLSGGKLSRRSGFRSAVVLEEKFAPVSARLVLWNFILAGRAAVIANDVLSR